MGLSTALYNGISGLSTLAESLNVIGDNLANVNTPGFKSSTALFETVFSQTISGATVSNANLFGTNPIQVGLGTTLATISRSFLQGGLNNTGSLSDMAIQGKGFFILSDGTDMVYTRDGSFALSIDGTLVDPATGLRVQGYTAQNGVVTATGAVGDIVIPLGTSIVQETANAFFAGNFDASGALALNGAVLDSAGLIDNTTLLAADALTDLLDLQDMGGVNLGLAIGDTITLTGRKGGADITASFIVGTDVTLLGDLTAAIELAFGIADDGSVDMDPAGDGSILITSDRGFGNAISDVILSSTSIAFNDVFNPGGGVGFTEITPADGESFILSGLNVFDSLGNEVPLSITFTRTGTNTLTYLAESPIGTSVGSGEIEYDSNGQFISVSSDVVTIDRSGAGAIDPLTVQLDFSGTSFLSGEQTLAMGSQDGFPIGSLEEFFIGVDGTITGLFSNGLTQLVGQVALANFSNQQGLLAIGSNLFATTGNSGEAIIGAAGTGGRGTIAQGFLEGSNTDMAREFTNIIITQRGFQANARTISTADALLEEVIALAR
jgi:flagellar hook protein FlgE